MLFKLIINYRRIRECGMFLKKKKKFYSLIVFVFQKLIINYYIYIKQKEIQKIVDIPFFTKKYKNIPFCKF